MAYAWTSPIGTFTIRPHTTKPGWWRLWINDIPVAPYKTAAMAADDVLNQATGFTEFDMLDNVQPPAGLLDWIAD